jgi:hypothetical protein
MELKYIVTEENRVHHFCIFDKTQVHSDIAHGMEGQPVGAGFCTIVGNYDPDEEYEENDNVIVHCYGRSNSLDIISRPEDSEIIAEKLNRQEYA